MGWVIVKLLSFAQYLSDSRQIQRPREAITRINRTTLPMVSCEQLIVNERAEYQSGPSGHQSALPTQLLKRRLCLFDSQPASGRSPDPSLFARRHSEAATKRSANYKHLNLEGPVSPGKSTSTLFPPESQQPTSTHQSTEVTRNGHGERDCAPRNFGEQGDGFVPSKKY